MTLTSSHNEVIKIEFILKNRNTTKEINVNKSWFFEKINEIDKSLIRLMKNKQTDKENKSNYYYQKKKRIRHYI